MEPQFIKTQIVELVVAAVPSPGNQQTQLSFNNQNFLLNKKICSIEFYSLNDMALSPLGNPLAQEANIKNAYLTLYGADPENSGAFGEWIQFLPLWNLHRLNNGVDPYVYQLFTMSPRIITWEKSFITLKAPLANINNNVSFIFNVGYIGSDN